MADNEKKHYSLKEYNKESPLRAKCRGLCYKYNKINPLNIKKRNKVLSKIIPNMGEGCKVNQPFVCEYGTRIKLGNRVFINNNGHFNDAGGIEIGDDCAIGPNCVIATVSHADDTLKTLIERESYTQKVTIGKNCWIASNCVISQGVTIGDNVVVASGAVVTKDVPSGVMVAGVPATIKKVFK